MFLIWHYIVFALEWNNSKELHNHPAANRALEMVPDPTLTAHIQVMLMQSFNPFFLKMVFLLFWLIGLDEDIVSKIFLLLL